MKAVTSFALKALRVGPLPYLGLAVAVIGVGAVLQMRGGDQGFAGGRTLFGTFAQIGGCIGLFGLATMVIRGLPPEGQPDEGIPQSARSARMEGADPKPRTSTSPAARAGAQMARRIGMQAIRQLGRR